MRIIYFIVSVFSLVSLLVKQARCKHEKYHETMACDAICTSCGKNLGFIGTIRDKQNKK